MPGRRSLICLFWTADRLELILPFLYIAVGRSGDKIFHWLLDFLQTY